MFITITSTLLIVLTTFTCYFYINKQQKIGKLVEKRRWIESLPSLISTLGVLGTFLGITIGLLAFDTSNLEQSIPELLDGLKTAFFTSLAGMLGSLFLSRIVNAKYDDSDKGVSDINQAATLIVQNMNQMNTQNAQFFTHIQQILTQQAQLQTTFYQSIGQAIVNMQNSVNQSTQEVHAVYEATSTMLVVQQSQNQNIVAIKNSTDSVLTIIGNIEEYAKKNAEFATTFIEPLKETLSNLNELFDIVSTMPNIQQEISDEVKQLGDKLHAEVVEIEDAMAKTDKLLEVKFTEFSDLLKKSNTEALVEVMKKVTEEFQKQMNALINKLIQENFDQLNKSVERLNIWQQENKEMISSLTAQYKQMTEEFNATSTTLEKVGKDTQALVSDGSKLRELIDILNQIIVDDRKFTEMSTRLQEACTLTATSMEKFEESNNHLNEWVRKQRNFVDAVQQLLAQLEEIGKIKDYDEQFWQGTKKSLEEGVSIIRRGSDSLNMSLKDLNAEFYTRLNTTLSELDKCIQAMVLANQNRR